MNEPKPEYPREGTVFEQLTTLSIEMTGDPAANPFTAFAQWQEERDAMRIFFDQNEALKILNRRLQLTLTLAEKAIRQVEEDAGMFIKDGTRKSIAQFREQVQKLDTTKTLSQEIHNEQIDRRITEHD